VILQGKALIGICVYRLYVASTCIAMAAAVVGERQRRGKASVGQKGRRCWIDFLPFPQHEKVTLINAA
jgi:hypothetical protein